MLFKQQEYSCVKKLFWANCVDEMSEQRELAMLRDVWGGIHKHPY